jgi:hypothetical protein
MRLSTLRLFHPSQILDVTSLTEQEIHTIAVHIFATVPRIDAAFGDYDVAIPKLCRLLSTAIVAEVSVSNEELISSTRRMHGGCAATINRHFGSVAPTTTSAESSTKSAAPSTQPVKILYTRGVPTSKCIFILSGVVNVFSGDDEFKTTLGPWTVIGQHCLQDPESPAFTPDFTAVVASRKVKYLSLKADLDSNRNIDHQSIIALEDHSNP